ncbi:MAG TPA: hypothetical protein VGI39_06260 [Polyangiaceae bacterium]|jgi:hypothetical protein
MFRPRLLGCPAVVGIVPFVAACAGQPTGDSPWSTPPPADAAPSAPAADTGTPDPAADATTPPLDATTPDAAPPDAAPGASSDATADAALDAPVDSPPDAPPSPPLDASDDASDAAVPATPCTTDGTVVSWINGKVRVDYDLSNGTSSFSYDGAKRILGFYAGVQLTNYVTTKSYATHTCANHGSVGVVTSTAPNLPTLEQSFYLDGGNHFLTRLTVYAPAGSTVATNWIGPVVMDTQGGIDVGTYADIRFLKVPFDNDAWVTYDALTLPASGVSFEAAALYDNTTRNGFVFGSVTHDLWKSGVYYNAGGSTKIDALNVFGGETDATYTHDVLPHPQVTGAVVASPLAFVGFGPDWRDEMEEFAAENAANKPKLAWNGGVPFGWNSWGKIQSAISSAKADAVSDAIKNNLPSFADQGTVYVNLDSYWDNLSSAQLDDFVAHCAANGQKAGIYWAPFVDWGLSATRTVEGTSYTYGQIWLKDGKGNPIKVDGAYAVDPTHPGTKGRIDTFIDAFKAHGFSYIKLDFLSHGALESSVRYDPSVQTGIQAYNQGMQYVVDRLGGTMFISESIAPLFPNGYAHARRVACDTYGVDTGSLSTQYEMNSASYGWWLSGALYPFNDPDEMLLQGFSATDNMSRLISGAVSGTVFLNGDDLTDPTALALARAYLTNDRINAVAKLGRAFRPLEGNTGTNPSDVLTLHDPSGDYIAAFNYTTSAVTKAIDLTRAGLNGSKSYAVTDLWTGAGSTAQGTLSVAVDAGSAKLLMLQ